MHHYLSNSVCRQIEIMRDTRYWAEQDLVNFIELYKSLPCLWKIKSKDYTNKQLKNRAYEKLVELCRNTVYPEANRDFVTKKIQSLRGTFRKELKKVCDSRASGVAEDDVYTPNLWYFNLLLFTRSQEDPNDDNGDIKVELDADDDVDYDEVDAWTNSPVNASEIKAEAEENIIEPPEETLQPQETNVSANADTQFNMVYKGTKRKIPGPERNLLHKHTNTDLDEFEAVGVIVGKKLQRMDPLQAIYAEALINKVLMKGLLKNLSENTDVFENVPYYERQNPQTSNFFAENSPSAPGSSQDGHFSQFHKKSQEILPQKEENE